METSKTISVQKKEKNRPAWAVVPGAGCVFEFVRLGAGQHGAKCNAAAQNDRCVFPHSG